MQRKFTAVVAAATLVLATLAPTGASAQRWGHDDYYGGADAYGCRDDNNHGCERDRDRRLARSGYGNGYGNGYGDRYGYGDDYYRRGECYDRYGRNHCYDRDDDDDYDNAVAAGVIGLVLGAVIASAVANGNNRQDDNYQSCTRQERRWDRQRQRYIYVDVPC